MLAKGTVGLQDRGITGVEQFVEGTDLFWSESSWSWSCGGKEGKEGRKEG